mmetsp:Transcript_94875/g.263574  ORF Transcript_94875/g.263574 Transcript_94875/m.263574 type:complete len:229 (+) Transcript_94875:103-789(+)
MAGPGAALEVPASRDHHLPLPLALPLVLPLPLPFHPLPSADSSLTFHRPPGGVPGAAEPGGVAGAARFADAAASSSGVAGRICRCPAASRTVTQPEMESATATHLARRLPEVRSCTGCSGRSTSSPGSKSRWTSKGSTASFVESVLVSGTACATTKRALHGCTSCAEVTVTQPSPPAAARALYMVTHSPPETSRGSSKALKASPGISTRTTALSAPNPECIGAAWRHT